MKQCCEHSQWGEGWSGVSILEILEPQRNIINILYKIVMKFIYKDSKPKQKIKTAIMKCNFLTMFEKNRSKKIANNLTSDFSFARSLFLSCSTIWMPEIANISSYKRTSYLSETGPECIRSWDFDWQVSRTCERNRLWLGSLNHVSVMREWITVNLLR